MLHQRVYLDPSDERVYLDTYVADYKNHPHPAMLVLPGGGYCNVCSDREGEPIALAFVAHDYNAFVLNYRVGRPGDVYPKQLIDASRAILYIRENAVALGVDPNRVFVVGFSAGGHLAGSLAILHSDPEVVAALGIKDFANRPNGAILSYPVTTVVRPSHMSSFEYLTGKVEEELTDDDIKRYSLEYHVDENTAPIFLWHTVTDELVPAVGSLRLLEALIRHQIPNMAVFYPYGRHGMALANGMTDNNYPGFVDPICEGWVDSACEFLATLNN